MLGNINPRQMQKMMKRLGMQQQEISASEVIIKTEGKDFIFLNPQVSRINMMGQDTWQIVGESKEMSREIFNKDDVATVMQQTAVDEEKAKAALEESKGDLAEAILKLKSQN